MITKWWLELTFKFPTVSLDAYVVMPNHIHGIIGIGLTRDGDSKQGAHPGAPLPTMIQWFKTLTTNEYIRAVKRGDFQPFDRRVWQRNYYEHIIRNETEFDAIRKYIANNPLNWGDDELNPEVKKTVHPWFKA